MPSSEPFQLVVEESGCSPAMVEAEEQSEELVEEAQFSVAEEEGSWTGWVEEVEVREHLTASSSHRLHRQEARLEGPESLSSRQSEVLVHCPSHLQHRHLLLVPGVFVALLQQLQPQLAVAL